MDKRIIGYFKGKKDLALIVIALALGLILIFLGGKVDSEPEAEEVGEEERIATACSRIDGVGECTVYLYYSPSDSHSKAESVESVIVVCEGADSPDVRLRLTEMLSSFFGIGTNRIRIEKLGA